MSSYLGIYAVQQDIPVPTEWKPYVSKVAAQTGRTVTLQYGKDVARSKIVMDNKNLLDKINTFIPYAVSYLKKSVTGGNVSPTEGQALDLIREYAKRLTDLP